VIVLWILFILVWLNQLWDHKQLNEDLRIMVFVVTPFIWLSRVFLFNIWGRHLIGYNEIMSLKEFIVLSVFF
jgi:hypothetical protein